MCKDSSAKYYKYNKERLQKRLMKDIKVFSKKEKKKSNNIVVSYIEISLKMRNIVWLSTEKKRKNRSTIVSIMCNIKQIKNE